MKNPFLKEFRTALQLPMSDRLVTSEIVECAQLPSYFAVSEMASASVLAVGEALRALMSFDEDQKSPTVQVNQRLASLWFGSSLHLLDPNAPAVWDEIAGDYQCADGWIRLHTNAPHHKLTALKVLGVASNRDAVAEAVKSWTAIDLETAIVGENGAAAQMRSMDEWALHPQGKSLAAEPLVAWQTFDGGQPKRQSVDAERPLAGIKVLDLTRVIAGPVCTRTLAALGANVLRIDPTNWDEPGLYEELTIGKRCAHLDLKTDGDFQNFKALLTEADVLVHGLRADALKRLGLSEATIRDINPQLIEVTHNAYGWTGPWRNRRGFDSLVQMSSGIADFGMKQQGDGKPHPLPVQALDHATGYLAAATAIIGLKRRNEEGCGVTAKLSLARTAHSLIQTARNEKAGQSINPIDADYHVETEQTHLGPAMRLLPCLEVEGVRWHWDLPASPLRSTAPTWSD